ncbi:Guanylin [Heterocephalus glaber]|uniref:Guanylin n=1 Tax=Heterocephalus glaber TaxID=10181 RepID=G5AQJ1_HETGA|nr:guanylin isoform X1 [Heterocephalus glaber]EHA99301.1 Guanylin [Heterocephalus glaber]
MNSFLLSALWLLGVWAALAGGVTVQDGDFSFPLESVKKLKDLREIQEPAVEGRRKLVALPLCSHPGFPEELRLVCREPNAPDILHRLEAIAQDPSTCEICAYAACAGC